METLSHISQKPSPDETSHAAIIHISGLSSLIGVPFGSILGPLITWLIWRDKSQFADENGKEALNLNISMFLYQFLLIVVGLILFLSPIISMAHEADDDPLFILFSLPGIWILFVGFGLVFLLRAVLIIIASIKSSNGEVFRYPLTIRLIK